MRVHDMEPPMEATEAYQAQLELCDALWIPEDRAERQDLADLAIKAAQECHAFAESARAQGDALNAELNQQRAKSIFADVIRLTIGDMRAALYAKYPNLTDDAAEDVLQEAFIRAYKSFPQFNHRSRFHTWMYRTAMNEAIRRFEKQKRNQHEQVEDLPPAEVHKHASLSASEYNGDKKQVLRELLQELKPDVREMIWLAHVEGYSFPEVAEMVSRRLGVKKNAVAVKVRVHRAINDLRERIKERGLSIDDF